MKGFSPAVFDPFPSLIEVAENALSVMYLAATDLSFVEPHGSTAEALVLLESNGFDAAPVSGVTPVSYVDIESLETGGATVRECAKSLDATVLATSTLGLADGIRLLGEQPYFFVIDGRQLVGIVTRADLQRQAVSMVLLSFILVAESGLNALIPRYLGESWPALLPEATRHDLERMYERRTRANAELSLLDCLMLHQRLDLVLESGDLAETLGFPSRKALKTWKSRLASVRDILAHGGGLLHAEPDPLRAIELFDLVRTFAERVWAEAAVEPNDLPE